MNAEQPTVENQLSKKQRLKQLFLQLESETDNTEIRSLLNQINLILNEGEAPSEELIDMIKSLEALENLIDGLSKSSNTSHKDIGQVAIIKKSLIAKFRSMFPSDSKQEVDSEALRKASGAIKAL